MNRGLKNLSWLLSDNIVNLIIGLFTSTVVVRYLGPEKNGIFSFCIAYVSLWSVLADMGSANIIQKEEILGHKSTQTLLSSGLLIGFIGGISITLGATISLFLSGESSEVVICVAIIGSSYIAKAFYVIKYILLARLQAGLLVKANIRIQFIMAFIKIAIVVLHGDIFAFAACYSLEAILQAVAYIQIIKKQVDKINCLPSFHTIKYILRQGWPYIISSFAVIIYMKSDQLMVRKMLGDNASGIYSVAVTISEFAQFIPMAMSNTMLPILAEKYKSSKEDFQDSYIDYFEKSLLIIAITIIALLISANLAVFILYGKSYMPAASIVRIYAVSQLFVAIGVTESSYINLHGLQKKSMISTCIAAIINLILNYILIKQWGCNGAALATIIAMSSQTILVFIFWSDTRQMLKFITKALYFRHTRKQLRKASVFFLENKD